MQVRQAVQNSLPSLTRPRLSTESERRLAEVDQKSALCYADAEALTERALDLASRLKAAAQVSHDDDSAIPVEFNSLEDTSAVHHIEELRVRLSTGETPPIKLTSR